MKYRTENTFSGSFFYLKGDDPSDTELKYDITGFESLSKAFLLQSIKLHDLNHFIKELGKIGTSIENKNLNINGLVLNPDCIFISQRITRSSANQYENITESSIDKIRFIYYNGHFNISFEKRIISIGEFIIMHVDYNDPLAIDRAYNFYMQVYKGNYVFR